MVRRNMALMIVAVCLVAIACPGDGAPENRAGDAKVIEGLWSGSWGGGERGGVVFQPVIAELFIQGDKVEMAGFRNVGRVAGTVRFDTQAKRMRITPAAATGGGPAPKAIDYGYVIKSDTLTLTGDDKASIVLHKLQVVEKPLANVPVEFVTATGIDDAGNLLVTEFTTLKAGRAGTTYFQPSKKSLSTKQATVFVMQETSLKKTTVQEARRLIRKSPPVVVAYRQDNGPPPPRLHELWKDMGSPVPDSDAVQQTFARVLRPGTVVFVLSARENVPKP